MLIITQHWLLCQPDIDVYSFIGNYTVCRYVHKCIMQTKMYLFLYTYDSRASKIYISLISRSSIWPLHFVALFEGVGCNINNYKSTVHMKYINGVQEGDSLMKHLLWYCPGEIHLTQPLWLGNIHLARKSWPTHNRPPHPNETLGSHGKMITSASVRAVCAICWPSHTL